MKSLVFSLFIIGAVASHFPVKDPILNIYIPPPEGCTSIGVGPKASTDGSMVTHTNDCKDCDFRLSLVKGKVHDDNSLKPVAPSRFSYPRYVGYDRGNTLNPENVDKSIFSWSITRPIDHIPQVHQTYNYIDGNYAIMNERQVAIGESTCAARLIAIPRDHGGKALFDVSELTRIALERATTAREAIQIMGDLAVEYGYYGAEWEGDFAYAEAGEALTVSDPHEVWMFHILPDDTGASAVWAAQRVPADHVAVVANAFVLKEINEDDRDNFMFSNNLFEVAIRNNFWDPQDGPLNFQKAYGAHVSFDIYCSRRVWRVFDLVAPSLRLNPNSSSLELPFSVKVDKLISARDVMNIMRDHYEGTAFDLTKGLAAGPFGNPNRYDRGDASGAPMAILLQGTFERAISLFRTSYSFVTQSRSWLPDLVGGTVWFGFAAPHATCYAPLYPSSSHLPVSFTQGHLYAFSRGSAWWAFTAVGNYMERMFKYMRVDVEANQRDSEQIQVTKQSQAEGAALRILLSPTASHMQPTGSDVDSAAAAAAAATSPYGAIATGVDLTRAYLTKYQNENAAGVVDSWWKLFEHLMTRYHDGYRLDDFHAETIDPTSLFYPLDWLEKVHFFPAVGPDFTKTTYKYTDDPLAKPAGWYHPQGKSKQSQSAVATSETSDVIISVQHTQATAFSFHFFLVSFACVCSFLGGMYFGRKSHPHPYASIP